MRYAPYPQDYAALQDMSEADLLEYFLTRVFETEEVWGLDDGCEWLMLEVGEQWVMPVWPYRQLAEEANTVKGYTPLAESLEDFVYQTLSALIEDNAMLRVLPSTHSEGCLVSPERLYDILTGMFDAGEYKLDA